MKFITFLQNGNTYNKYFWEKAGHLFPQEYLELDSSSQISIEDRKVLCETFQEKMIANGWVFDKEDMMMTVDNTSEHPENYIDPAEYIVYKFFQLTL